MNTKIAGGEVPKTLRVSACFCKRVNLSLPLQKKKQEMPVSPLVLGLFLFLVIGSAIVAIINNSERNDAMMEEMMA